MPADEIPARAACFILWPRPRRPSVSVRLRWLALRFWGRRRWRDDVAEQIAVHVTKQASKHGLAPHAGICA